MNHEPSYPSPPATTCDDTTLPGTPRRLALLRKPVASDRLPCKREASPPGQGDPAGPIGPRPGHAICRFAPSHHQAATVAGLSRTYSAEEIGAIYASSWERYFSQGHADIASAVIAWTAVKNHAAKHNGATRAAAAIFRAAVRKLIKGDL